MLLNYRLLSGHRNHHGGQMVSTELMDAMLFSPPPFRVCHVCIHKKLKPLIPTHINLHIDGPVVCTSGLGRYPAVIRSRGHAIPSIHNV